MTGDVLRVVGVATASPYQRGFQPLVSLLDTDTQNPQRPSETMAIMHMWLLTFAFYVLFSYFLGEATLG